MSIWHDKGRAAVVGAKNSLIESVTRDIAGACGFVVLVAASRGSEDKFTCYLCGSVTDTAFSGIEGAAKEYLGLAREQGMELSASKEGI